MSSAYAKLPPPGTRVSPADATKMPKIVSTGETSPITIVTGANHWRLVGLEVTTASTQGGNSTQNPYTTILVYPFVPNITTTPPDSITVDRCYIHGDDSHDVREGVNVNASNMAVIDSYISAIHQSTNDSQAIEGWYTPGPIKITNNYLESTGENILFGGAGGLNNPWVPSDIEIRGNYLFKPLSWAKTGWGGTIPPGHQWAVKILFELKSARRVLVDGNVMENNWVSAQVGFAIALTPRTNAIGGSGLLAVVDDITLSNNVLKNVSSGFTTLAHDGPPNCLPTNGCTSGGEMKRVVLYNNLILLGDTSQTGYSKGYGWGGIINHDLTDFVVQHNTVVPPPNLSYCKASWYF